ncbi:MAG: midcut-by-XrtH protein [Rudaea sp.]
MNFRRGVNRFAFAPFAILGMTSSAWAGFPGTLTYAPAATPTSTPMLSAWTLLLLAILLAVVAYRVLRSRVSGRQLGHWALIGSLVAGGAASGDLIRLAHATTSPPVVSMSSATGGTANLGLGIQQVTNTSGVPQQITALTVTVNGDTFINPGGSFTPQCLVGTVVAPGGSCYIDLSSPA